MKPGVVWPAARLRSRIARHWHLGWPARAGITLAGVAALAAAIGLPWLQREAGAAHARAETLRFAAAAAQSAPAARLDDAASSTARIDSLPPAARTAQRISALLEGAARANVRLRRVEIQTRAEAPLAVERCVLRLPVKGSYVALRRFLAQAWADDPALAIDALQWRREPGSGEIQGELRISLYSRSGTEADLAPPRAGRAAEGGT